MKVRHVFTLAAVLVTASACQLEPIAEPAEAQEQPEAIEAVEAAAMAADVAAAEAEPGSTICRAFRSQLLEFQAQLAERPGDTELRAAGTTLEGIITQTCD